MFRRVDLLEVRAWGEPVGVLAEGPGGIASFEYDRRWGGRELSPLMMPTRPSGRVWSFPSLPRETFYGLPPLIADSAPDRFGNTVIAAALAREGISASEVRPIDRLAYVGSRAMGALTFHPSQSPQHPGTSFELATLAEAARAAVQGSLGAETRSDALNELLQVGSSAGGARAKAIIAWNPESNEVRAGGIAAPEGFEQWLLKFDGVGSDAQLGAGGEYGRTEYAYALMASACGIEMSECRLLEEGGRAHFMTRRFDRPGNSGDRLHMQSLCALLALDYNEVGVHDYASLFLAADELGLEPQAHEQLFRRMCFNVIASNNDDHTKNHSFIMDARGAWDVSPAYDVTFAFSPTSRWLQRHLMSVNGRFERIHENDLLRVADQFEIPHARRVIREITDTVSHWPEFAREAGISAARISEVGARLAEVRTELR